MINWEYLLMSLAHVYNIIIILHNIGDENQVTIGKSKEHQPHVGFRSWRRFVDNSSAACWWHALICGAIVWDMKHVKFILWEFWSGLEIKSEYGKSIIAELALGSDRIIGLTRFMV